MDLGGAHTVLTAREGEVGGGGGAEEELFSATLYAPAPDYFLVSPMLSEEEEGYSPDC